MTMSPQTRSTRLATLVLALLLVGQTLACAGPKYVPSEGVPAHLVAAVNHRARPGDDRARDLARRPAEIMTFFGVAPGDQIADLAAGGGYYSQLFAHAVGPTGRVFLHNAPLFYEKFGDMGVPKRLEKTELHRVERLDKGFGELGLPRGELDAVFLFLFYHDLYWIETDRKALLRDIRKALRPGGIFGIIDHHAEDGSGERDVKTLHRGDAKQIKREIVAAGFVFDGETDLLRNPEDDRTGNVFDEELRGKTDRFVYRFVKPGR